MRKILAIDLGKFKSVSCLLNTETNETEYWTLETTHRVCIRPTLLALQGMKLFRRHGLGTQIAVDDLVLAVVELPAQ